MIGLEILLELGAKDVQVIEDSQLVLRQLTYKCNSLLLAPYFTVVIQLLDSFDNVEFEHMPRELNWEANELDQIAFGVKMGEELTYKFFVIEKKNHHSIFERGINLDIFNNDMNIVGEQSLENMWRIQTRRFPTE